MQETLELLHFLTNVLLLLHMQKGGYVKGKKLIFLS